MPRSSSRAVRPAARFACALLATVAALAVGASPASGWPAARGVQLHSLWWGSTDADMDRELDLAAEAHSTVARVDVAWGSLEQEGKGQLSQWYTTKLDRFIDGAHARGMKVIATLWASPCWASSAPDSLKQDCSGDWWGRGVAAYPPTNTADYADAARWITSRYGTELAALEIWNEPNGWDGTSRFWHAADPAGAYAALVRAAYPAAKAGNAAVPVLAGALAGSDRAFLEAMYANGVQGSYDGLSSHPYADPGFVKLSALRAAQTAAGDTTPIWATEFGYPTGTGPEWHVSEAEQASNLEYDFADLDRLDWVAGAIVYDLRDDGTDPGAMEDNFGVVRRDFTPKQGYGAMAVGLSGAADGLRRGVPVATMAAVRDPAGPPAPAPRTPAPRWKGMTIRFTLSTAAPVRIEFLRSKPGRRVGRRCAGQSRFNVHRRRCRRMTAAGSLRQWGAKGPNSLRFMGRLASGRALTPGRYTLRITATYAGRRRTLKTRLVTIPPS